MKKERGTITVVVGIASEKNRDFMSAVVETLLFRNYSHIFIVYKGRMYHALPEGMSVDLYDEFKITHDIVGEKKVKLYCSEKTFLEHHSFYKKCDYTHSQGLGFIPFFGRIFRNGRSGALCSEYVAWVLNDLARRWEFGDSEMFTPTLFEKI